MPGKGYANSPKPRTRCSPEPLTSEVACDLALERALGHGADHLLHELPTLLDFVSQGRLNLDEVSATTIPLDADAINNTLDDLENFGGALRTVITP